MPEDAGPPDPGPSPEDAEGPVAPPAPWGAPPPPPWAPPGTPPPPPPGEPGAYGAPPPPAAPPFVYGQPAPPPGYTPPPAYGQPPGYPPAYGPPPGYGGGWYPPPGYGYPAPTGTDTLAVWSLILGIASLVCLGLLAGIPAIVLGVSSRRRIRATGGQRGGSGLATAGLVTGIIGTLWSTAVILLAIIGVATQHGSSAIAPLR